MQNQNYSNEPMETQYFTIQSLENDCNVSLLLNESIETDEPIWYRINNGEWNILTSDVNISINNNRVSLKYTYTESLIENLPHSTNIISGISVTKKYAVYGNIMSLVYGDDFIDKTIIDEFITFEALFMGEVGLIDASNLILPATEAYDFCYSDMFYGCTSLTKAPELPAIDLYDYCYSNMFYGCTSLTKAPELPATVLYYGCYQYMFYGCTSLTKAPELPAIDLYDYCYSNMFYGCTSLTKAPELPATTLSDYCYASMFRGCTSLTTAPELPATVLYDYCYSNMFNGCTSLTKAPELPATTLDYNCYNRMFYNCTSLNEITLLCMDVTMRGGSEEFFNEWVYNVSQTGTFNKYLGFDLMRGDSGIPTEWSINDSHEYVGHLTFVTLEDNVTVKFRRHSADYTSSSHLYYSINGLPGSGPYYDQELSVTASTAGSTIRFQLYNPECFSGQTDTTDNENKYGIGTFSTCLSGITYLVGKCDVKGNIMSLLYGEAFKNESSLANYPYAFAYLFEDCHIVDASNLILPTTTLSPHCYRGMFKNCASLTRAPELPATTLADYCYHEMFYGCGLTASPILPSTTLTDYCYEMLFMHCTQLNKVTIHAKRIEPENAIISWLYNVNENGTIYVPSDFDFLTLSTDTASGVPKSWNTVRFTI